ncbi:MAG: YciC family protein [Methyloceanibacter sp.]
MESAPVIVSPHVIDGGFGAALRMGGFEASPLVFIGTALVIFLLYGFVDLLASGVDRLLSGSPERTVLGALLSLGFSTLVSLGATAFYLAAHDNPQSVSLSSIWHPAPFWNYLAVTILLSLVIAVGFVLFVVPGIIWLLMFAFSPLIVVDRSLGPINAMKESKRIAYGRKWWLLGFFAVLVLVNMLGLLAFAVGLLVSVPVSTLAFVHAYRVLSGKVEPRQADAMLTA